ncbi:unnamed protein product, partial [Meganyctiphanes norvegica]
MTGDLLILLSTFLGILSYDGVQGRVVIPVEKLTTHEIWKHLLNLFQYPHEDRYFSRGDGDENFLYLLDIEMPFWKTDTSIVVVPALTTIKRIIQPGLSIRNGIVSPFDSRVKSVINQLEDNF